MKADLISKGALICDPSIFSALQLAEYGGTLATTGFPITADNTKALRISYTPAGNSVAQVAHSTPVEFPAAAGITGILYEVFNPHPYPLPFSIQLFNEAGVVQSKIHSAVDVGSGWQLCFVPVANWATNTWIDADSLKYVRATYAAGEISYSGLTYAAGDTLYFGRMWINPTQLPIYMLHTDDGTTHNLVAPASVAGFPLSGTTYKDIFAHYGFRGTAYIPTAYTGVNSLYMSWDQLRSLQDDYGWSIGSHSHTHPYDGSAAGLRLLGPYGYAQAYPGSRDDDVAIYDDIMQAVDLLMAHGLTGALHFALPQGAWDPYVISACRRAGLLSVRGTSAVNRGFPVRGAKSTGRYNYGPHWLHGWTDLTHAIDYETINASTSLDETIRVGATGCAYGHWLNTATYANQVDAVAAGVKTAQDAGSVRSMTVEEYYDATRELGGRCKFDGTFPALTDTTTIGAIDQVQVWSGHPASSIIVKVLQGL